RAGAELRLQARIALAPFQLRPLQLRCRCGRLRPRSNRDTHDRKPSTSCEFHPQSVSPTVCYHTQVTTTSNLIAPARGKLGVLIPGLGAVSTTFIAGVEAVRKGWAKPIGSLTQMGTIRLGKRTDKRSPLLKEFLPLAGLDDLVFGGWDIFHDDCFQAASNAAVLDKELLQQTRPLLSSIQPIAAVFDKNFVKRLDGPNVKKAPTKWDLAEKLREDIRSFRSKNGCDRLVMIWCGSTEAFRAPGPVHASLEAFEAGLKANHPDIAPSMVYAYAALQEGVPYANGAPNLTTDTGALLALSGWFSTNILGNRDGEVLDDPESFKTKEESKLSVLEHILQPDLYPDLYKNFYHKVRINYYPPRGDNKEGWDNIDIFGWLGYPMQIKVD